ncbi:unnamed protein product [Closterium sp. Naga37s-1]|nr:unnamed protein product [Closterium sp. Naga37s-1]
MTSKYEDGGERGAREETTQKMMGEAEKRTLGEWGAGTGGGGEGGERGEGGGAKGEERGGGRWSRQEAALTWMELRDKIEELSFRSHHSLPSYPMEQAGGGADMEQRGKVEEFPFTLLSPLMISSPLPSLPPSLPPSSSPDGSGKGKRRLGAERLSESPPSWQGGRGPRAERQNRGATLSCYSPSLFTSPRLVLPSSPPPRSSRWSWPMEQAGGGADVELRGKIEEPPSPLIRLRSSPSLVPSLPLFLQMELASGGADLELRGKIEELRAVSSASVAQTNSSMEQMQQQFAALSRRLGDLDRRVTSAMQDPTMRLVLQGSAPLFSPSLGEGEDRSSPPSLGEEGEEGEAQGDSERRGEGSQGVRREEGEARERSGEAVGSGEVRRGSGESGEDERREGEERREEGGGGSDGARVVLWVKVPWRAAVPVAILLLLKGQPYPSVDNGSASGAGHSAAHNLSPFLFPPPNHTHTPNPTNPPPFRLSIEAHHQPPPLPPPPPIDQPTHHRTAQQHRRSSPPHPIPDHPSPLTPL